MEIDKKEFNEFCAEVVAWKYRLHEIKKSNNRLYLYYVNSETETFQARGKYEPYKNLNQLAEVVEEIMRINDSLFVDFINSISSRGGQDTISSFRDFVITFQDKSFEVNINDKGNVHISLDEVINSMKELEGWLDNESFSLGAVDGYDYNSGVEYGLRLASIETKKRIKALQQKFGDKQ